MLTILVVFKKIFLEIVKRLKFVSSENSAVTNKYGQSVSISGNHNNVNQKIILNNNRINAEDRDTIENCLSVLDILIQDVNYLKSAALNQKAFGTRFDQNLKILQQNIFNFKYNLDKLSLIDKTQVIIKTKAILIKCINELNDIRNLSRLNPSYPAINALKTLDNDWIAKKPEEFTIFNDLRDFLKAQL